MTEIRVQRAGEEAWVSEELAFLAAKDPTAQLESVINHEGGGGHAYSRAAGVWEFRNAISNILPTFQGFSPCERSSKVSPSHFFGTHACMQLCK